jgi:hypothetical protein
MLNNCARIPLARERLRYARETSVAWFRPSRLRALGLAVRPSESVHPPLIHFGLVHAAIRIFASVACPGHMRVVMYVS